MSVHAFPRRDVFEEMESLKAFLGSRGVKVSALKGDTDYWQAAAILWPGNIKHADGGMPELLRQIRTMSKKARRKADLSGLPIEWRGAK